MKSTRLLIAVLIWTIIGFVTGFVAGRNQVLNANFVEPTPDAWADYEAFMEGKIADLLDEAVALVMDDIEDADQFFVMRTIEKRASVLDDNLGVDGCSGYRALHEALQEFWWITDTRGNGTFVTPTNLWPLKIEKALYLAEIGYETYTCSRD